MKQIYFLFVLALAFPLVSQAQNTVEVDANATFLGFANVFETPANGGAFVFGSAWGVPDIQTVVDAGAGTITLQPNFNTYEENPLDPFWVDQTTGEGNKFFVGSTYVEDNTLIGSALTFTGGCIAKTLDPEYDVVAFIRVFNADFSVLKEETAALTAGQNFSVTYTNVEGTDTTLQYGFAVSGINANPADEGALGSAVVTTPITVGIDDNDFLNVTIYPNPSNTNWNIATPNAVIDTIELYDVLGKRVSVVTVESNTTTINGETLAKGLYLAKISTNTGQKTVKLIKK
jgi:hypothetical protein